ncbi:lytic polysaccharide monooxygenase [Actinoplanes sp. N902-109]|uniref:lytic polysaccharide monooxygenase n=1 Tax=Actinoplanes sp. (strain N902-109) TaxID=649831 RepID=UPI00039FC4BF|nr:lytic polysaccharide monooxygenase [Actinoplanes sp. N902-109]
MKSLRVLGALTAGGLVALTPAAALAHGAPTTPISRTAACAGGGEEPDAAACRAARKAHGGTLGSFDNLRIANVRNDKETVPDGKLCSGGLPAYEGLDLPRSDWPATKVTAGSTLSVRYAGTIPHKGSFRLYLTKPGYAPSEPLGWDDLTSKPVATFQDPAYSGGSYRMSVQIPEDRSGRHVLYIVWETSSTPDTYYSCSDLVVKAPAAVATKPSPTVTRKPARSPSPAPSSAAPKPATIKRTSPAPARTTSQPAPQLDPVAAESTDDRAQLGHWIIAGALVAIAGAGGAALLGRLRRR